MLGLDDHLQINKEEVAAQVIDGEAIMINLSNGTYYSSNSVGGFIWEMIEGESSMGEIAERVAARYDVPEGQARADVERLATELAQEGLVMPLEKTLHGGKDRPPEPAQKLPYESPHLEIYRDMADLLALDPPMPGLGYTPWE